MRVCQCVEFGAAVTVVDQARPALGAHDVSIQVAAAGVAYVDALTAAGLYQIKPNLPYVPGNEFSGVVAEVGAKVSHLKAGDRVMAIGLNALSEEIVVPAVTCVPIPSSVSDAAAGGFLISYATALYALENCGRIRSGETVLVLGAAGAVGMAAIQVAKALGAEVIAAASSEEKRQSCLASGADAVVDYSRENWRDQLKALTSSPGVDLVFDLVGGDSSETALRCLSHGGRLLVVGFASGEIAKIPLNLPLLKRCSIIGADFGGQARQEPEIVVPLVQRLMSLLAEGKITLNEPEVFPLAQTQKAFDKIMARKTIGKVVIAPGL